MTISANSLETEIEYPDSDGQPMTESDPTRDYLIYSVSVLELFFKARSDVYVSGNLFVYYERGVPASVVSPDVFVVIGVEKKKRRSYKAWEEGNVMPAFVLEITSKTTQENDEIDKPRKYQSLGVLEYFQYDPTGDYLRPALKGSRLQNNQYQPIPEVSSPENEQVLFSETLGLELRLNQGELRFYNPQTGERLLSHDETEQARQQAEQARQQAEQARQQAEQARQNAVSRLLAMGLSAEQVAEALELSLEQVNQLGSNSI